ncbi:MAG: hypothetical protein K6C97_07065 [Treponema sp.]|nr:hypothetical protein [Treponema sp.]
MINFVYEKFLDDGSSSGFSGDTDIGSTPISENVVPSTGQHVDITIQDEELESSDSSNHFVVGENHQMLNSSDVRNSVPNEPEIPSDNGFVPLRKRENLRDLSSKESVSEDELPKVSNEISQPSSLDNNGDVGIDTLPDMGNLEFGTSETSEVSQSDDSNMESGSEFVSSNHSRRNSNEVPEIKDAALMAKAISSALSDDNAI